MIPIWQRYLLKQFIKLFLFFLFSFYFLYVIIDSTTHMHGFLLGNDTPISKIAYYYLLQFIKRADVLLPLAFLFGTIKTLLALNIHRELLALQTAGIHIKKLLRPLWLMAILCTTTVIIVNEFVTPYSLNYIDQFYYTHLRHSRSGKRTEPIHVLHLEDHSRLIYQLYDPSEAIFFDVIWIRNPDDLYRMKSLKADQNRPEGNWVDHLRRNKKGYFEKVESFSKLIFSDLHWKKSLLQQGRVPFENRSISALWKLFHSAPLLSSSQRQEVHTQLLFKLTTPLLAILVLLGVAPICLRFTKDKRPFSIYALAVFALIALLAYLDSAAILGESGTVSPFIGILSPFILLTSMLGFKFFRS